jgi:hypothetical protein
MLTGIAILVHGPRYIPYGWVFVAVVVFLIALIFVRVYGRGGRSGGPTGHRSGRRNGHRSRQGTAHHASHPTEQGGNHEPHEESRRRPNRS